MKTIIPMMTLVALVMAQTLCAQDTASNGYKVIVHSSKAGTPLTIVELGRIFTGKSQVWQGLSESYMPATVPDDSPTMTTFTGVVLKKSFHQYKGIWDRILFSGGGVPPKSFGTSAEVVAYVSTTPGAVGIVEQNADTKDTVVLTFQ